MPEAIWRPPLSFLLAGLLTATSVPAAEVGSETLLSAEQSVPWRGVGRINVVTPRQRGMCTGALIAPDLVLTAAHCLVNAGSGRPVAPGNVHFVAGWHKGTMTGHSPAAAFVLHPDWVPGRPATMEALASDLALVRLKTPLAEAAAIPFGIGRPSLPGDPVTLVSYRRDRAHALTRQEGCSYRAIVGEVLVLDCPVAKGASGAPVFALIDGQPRVVAVLSAMAGEGEPRAFAARADTGVERLRALLD